MKSHSHNSSLPLTYIPSPHEVYSICEYHQWLVPIPSTSHLWSQSRFVPGSDNQCQGGTCHMCDSDRPYLSCILSPTDWLTDSSTHRRIIFLFLSGPFIDSMRVNFHITRFVPLKRKPTKHGSRRDCRQSSMRPLQSMNQHGWIFHSIPVIGWTKVNSFTTFYNLVRIVRLNPKHRYYPILFGRTTRKIRLSWNNEQDAGTLSRRIKYHHHPSTRATYSSTLTFSRIPTTSPFRWRRWS